MSAPTPSPTATTRIRVNGRPVEVVGPGGRRLLDVLRIDLGLTGTKEGCGEGECGACSVLLDGALVNSCLVPLCQADGHDVRRSRAWRRTGASPRSRQAFLELGGTQCGMCTPGMLLAGWALLASGRPAGEPEIREAIAGNLCRCTGYTKIIEAIEAAGPIEPGALTPGGNGADGDDVAVRVPGSLIDPRRARSAGTRRHPGPRPCPMPWRG